jgi:HEAT repeat protein
MTNHKDPQDAATRPMDGLPPFDVALARLSDPDDTVRTWAVIDLRYLGDPRAIPALFKVASDPSDGDTALEACDTLAVLIPSDDIPSLFRLVGLKERAYGEDPSPHSQHAYKKLRQHWENSVTYLANTLTDPDPDVRRRIAVNLSDHCGYLAPGRPLSETHLSEDTATYLTTRLVQALTQGLQDSQAAVRVACVASISRLLYDDVSLPERLLSLLRDIDKAVRAKVVYILQRYQIPYMTLEPYLHDHQPGTRAAAVSLLSRNLDGATCDALVAAGSDVAPEVRLAVLQRLNKAFTSASKGYMPLPGDPRLSALFPKFIRDPDPEVRDAAAKHLAELWEWEISERYLQALRDGDATARAAEFPVMSAQWGGMLFRYVRDLLHESDPAQRLNGADMLAWVDTVGPGSQSLFSLALQDTDPRVRLAAIEAALTQDDPRVLELMQQYVNDPDPAIATRARDAVARCQEALSYPSLIARFRNTLPPLQRARAVFLLAKSDDPRRMTILEDVLHDQDEMVRSYAVKLAGEWAEPTLYAAVQHLATEDPAPSVQRAAVIALGKYAHRDAIPLLLDRVRHGSYWVRYFAYAALEAITGEKFGKHYYRWTAWWAAQPDNPAGNQPPVPEE